MHRIQSTPKPTEKRGQNYYLRGAKMGCTPHWSATHAVAQVLAKSKGGEILI